MVIILKNRQREPAQPGEVKFSRRERGIALMVVMGFIIVLAVLASAFAINMRVESILARNAQSKADVEWLCRSGVELAKYVLGSQMANTQEPYDCLSQSWAGGPGSTNGFNPLLDTLNLNLSSWAPNSALGLIYPDGNPGDDYRCTIRIIDLERKYNINRAAPATPQQQAEIGRWPLQNAFVMMGVDNSLHDYLIDAIWDWCDVDEDRHVNGVENEYYQGLDPPYNAKNGPIDDLKELLLVKDITPKMFWGNRTSQLANSANTSAANLPPEDDEEPDYPIGLVDLYTPISVGYLNINTASLEVLQLLPGMDENRAAFIINRRAGLDAIEGTIDDEPYTNIAEIRDIPGFQRPEAVQNARRFLSVRSATFEVTVTGEIAEQSRTLVAVLSRKSPTEVNILYTYWK